MAKQRRVNKKNSVWILSVCWAIVMLLGIAFPVQGDHQKDYYSDPGLITVELEGQIVNYLACERITLDYPGLTGRCNVNMGCDSNGNIQAAVTGVPISVMKRLFRSQDGGKTWTSIQLPPTQGRDLVAFTVLDNNNLLLATNLDHVDQRMYLSSDMGSSWQYTTSLSPNPYQYIGEGFLSLTQLDNGYILFPISRYNDDLYETGIHGGVFVSTDKGNTFPKVYPTFEFGVEAHVLELQSGDLLGAFRYQRNRNPGETDEEILALGGNISPEQPFAFKNVFLGDSDDGGITWNNFRPLRDTQGRVLIKYGQCHGQLVQVPDGRVVLVHDNRYPVEERDVRARVSGDGGQTWDPEVYYLSFGLGNPASVVLDDGTIVTITGNWPFGPSGPTGPPSAQVIRWQLPPVITRAWISLNRVQLTFGAVINGSSTGSQGFMISNSGSGPLNWSISAHPSWLSCSPTSGANSGIINVSVNPSGLSAGTYPGTITISAPNAANSPQTIPVILHIYHSNQTSPPFGSFETPTHGSTVRSSVPFTGWAVDDLGVQSVKLYRKKGGAVVYIGDAVFVEGARPDVEQAYPGVPMHYRAGWGYMMLTNFLPGGNGTFTIHAIAVDLEGHQFTLGTKTIIVDNANAVKPFGAIDTPAQGGTASGSSFINWGWTLTPQPNIIPTDGSTINVYVDGIYLGHPTYNIYRSDIAALFPSYANSDGASGYFYLDTTKYENGVHTIQWTARDSIGNIDGIGSRYFTIQNDSPSEQRTVHSVPSETLDISKIPVDYSEPLRIKKWYNQDAEPETLYPDENGHVTIKIKELERIVIDFSEGVRGLAPFRRYTGHQLVGPQLRTLPIGSFLDTKRGIFYWQVGPGFIGEYHFVFIIKHEDEIITRKNIMVNIIPKFSK